MKYWVDWSDSAFPRIRTERSATEYTTLTTLTEAKREIYDHFRADIDHAREQIAYTRSLRAKYITED